jgi:hypothetical protein
MRQSFLSRLRKLLKRAFTFVQRGVFPIEINMRELRDALRVIYVHILMEQKFVERKKERKLTLKIAASEKCEIKKGD